MTNSVTKSNNLLADKLKGKIVVIDTSSLLMAGTGMLKVLNNCSLVIPAIVVKELEEKRTHSTIGHLAREWLRLLESLRVENGTKLSQGVKLEGFENLTIRVEPNHRTQSSLPEHLRDGSHDSTILAVAKNLSEEDKVNKIVLMSNDVPMKLHSTLDLEIDAVEFNANAIVPAKPFDGTYEISITDEDYSKAMESKDGLEKYILQALPKDRARNAYVKLVLESNKEELANILLLGDKLSEVTRKHRTSTNIVARTLEQDIAMEYLKKPYDEVSIVSLQGKAGSGKTLVTIAAGLDQLKAGRYQKVIVFRSLHEMGNGQEMGFLPGDVGEKMGAWAGAIYDAIDVIAASKKPLKKNQGPHADTALKAETDRLKAMVEVSPITYLRGRSLANSYLVLEEAQNFSRSEILNILSRAGEGSKIVFTFDDMQVDNKFLQTGSKADIWSVIESLKNEDIFAHISLKRTERSRVAEIASRIIAEQQ